ncbi:MAG: AAA family ATPase, partial [Ketobacter sp.]
MNRAKPRVLISWIGRNDLNALDGNGLGPLASTLTAVEFDRVELLYNYPEDEVKPYLVWLAEKVNADFQAHAVSLSSPV